MGIESCQSVFKHLVATHWLATINNLVGSRDFEPSRLFHIMSKLKQQHTINETIRINVYPNSSRVINVLTSICNSEPAYAFSNNSDMNLMLGNLLIGINSLELGIYPYENTGNYYMDPKQGIKCQLEGRNKHQLKEEWMYCCLQKDQPKIRITNW